MNKKGALGAVFLVVLVDLLGFGVVLPLLPFTASRFDASPLAIGLLYSIYSFSQLVCSPLWGGWSDRIGRRPIMLISTAGAAGSYLLFAFANSLPLLFLSRLFAGVMGGNISAAQAYVADVTEPSERARGMGLIGAAFGIGFALGPAISGFLLMPSVHDGLISALPAAASSFVAENPYSLPGLAAFLLSFCSFLMVVFFLPESAGAAAPAEDASRVKKTSVFSREFWDSLMAKDAGMLEALYFCLLIVMIGHSSLYSAFPLFCKQVLGLDAHAVGLQFLFLGVVTVLVQGGLIRPLAKRFGERKLLLAGNSLTAAGLALIPSAHSASTMFLYLGLVGVGASLNGPALTSLISKEAKPSHVGLAMGNAQAVSAMGRVLGPALGGILFGWKPQAPFLTMGLLLCFAVWLAWTLHGREIS